MEDVSLACGCKQYLLHLEKPFCRKGLLFALNFSLRQWSAITGKSRLAFWEWNCLPLNKVSSRMLLNIVLMLIWCVIKHLASSGVASWTWFDTLINLEKCSHFHPIRKVLENPLCHVSMLLPADNASWQLSCH